MQRAWLYLVFCLSGFAALLYQVVWQRALFSIFGINNESVTVVVTAFMLGLGVGSLVGGAVSKDPARPAVLLFSLVELGIGAFGFFSMGLLREVGALTLSLPPLGTALVTFLLVLIPTLLMGATLPVLVGHLVRESISVGRSVGTLYFVNTLGSAVASVASVLWLLPRLGQTGTVHLAALLNLLASAIVMVLYLQGRAASVRREQVAAVPHPRSLPPLLKAREFGRASAGEHALRSGHAGFLDLPIVRPFGPRRGGGLQHR